VVNGHISGSWEGSLLLPSACRVCTGRGISENAWGSGRKRRTLPGTTFGGKGTSVSCFDRARSQEGKCRQIPQDGRVMIKSFKKKKKSDHESCGGEKSGRWNHKHAKRRMEGGLLKGGKVISTVTEKGKAAGVRSS